MAEFSGTVPPWLSWMLLGAAVYRLATVVGAIVAPILGRLCRRRARPLPDLWVRGADVPPPSLADPRCVLGGQVVAWVSPLYRDPADWPPCSWN